jgi:hypothetical protein
VICRFPRGAVVGGHYDLLAGGHVLAIAAVTEGAQSRVLPACEGAADRRLCVQRGSRCCVFMRALYAAIPCTSAAGSARICIQCCGRCGLAQACSIAVLAGQPRRLPAEMTHIGRPCSCQESTVQTSRDKEPAAIGLHGVLHAGWDEGVRSRRICQRICADISDQRHVIGAVDPIDALGTCAADIGANESDECVTRPDSGQRLSGFSGLSARCR